MKTYVEVLILGIVLLLSITKELFQIISPSVFMRVQPGMLRLVQSLSWCACLLVITRVSITRVILFIHLSLLQYIVYYSL